MQYLFEDGHGIVGVMLGFECQNWRYKDFKASAIASDALPLPVVLTNKVFFMLFFLASYSLIHKWREKVRNSVPLYMLSPVEILASVSLLASCSYLLGFFGIAFMQNIIAKTSDLDNERNDNRKSPSPVSQRSSQIKLREKVIDTNGDEDIALAVVNGSVASHSLESRLGDCKKAISVRRRVVKIMMGNSLEGFDYKSIMGQCCELPIGYE